MLVGNLYLHVFYSFFITKNLQNKPKKKRVKFKYRMTSNNLIILYKSPNLNQDRWIISDNLTGMSFTS